MAENSLALFLLRGWGFCFFALNLGGGKTALIKRVWQDLHYITFEAGSLKIIQLLPYSLGVFALREARPM